MDQEATGGLGKEAPGDTRRGRRGGRWRLAVVAVVIFGSGFAVGLAIARSAWGLPRERGGKRPAAAETHLPIRPTPTRPVTFTVAYRRGIEVDAWMDGLDHWQAAALVEVLVRGFPVLATGGVSHTSFSLDRPEDAGSLLETLTECDLAMSEQRAPRRDQVLLREVLQAWFSAKDRWALTDEERAALSRATTSYYKSVLPIYRHHQVPRLVLAAALESADDWSGAAQLLTPAVRELPHDDVLRLAAMERLVNCLVALGRLDDARSVAEQAADAFGPLRSLPQYEDTLQEMQSSVGLQPTE